MKTDCEITSESSEMINDNLKYLHNLKELFLESKNEK